MIDYAKSAEMGFSAPLKDPTVAQRANFALKHIAASKTVLDVGCASGASAQIFKSHGKYVVGVDILTNYLRMAQKICDEVKLVDCSKKLPFKDNSFDAIYAGEFIEHLSEEDGNKFLEECYRILRQKGVLILTTPNPNFIKVKIMKIRMENEIHKKIYSCKELKKKLSTIGFDIIACKGLGKMAFFITSFIPVLCLYGDFGIVASK